MGVGGSDSYLAKGLSLFLGGSHQGALFAKTRAHVLGSVWLQNQDSFPPDPKRCPLPSQGSEPFSSFQLRKQLPQHAKLFHAQWERPANILGVLYSHPRSSSGGRGRQRQTGGPLPSPVARPFSQLPKASRPFDLLVFHFWSTFSRGPKK